MKRYNKKSSASDAQKSAVNNFFNDVAKPLLEFVNETLHDFDEESIYEILEIMPLILNRKGKNQRQSIKDYLNNGKHETDEFEKISAGTANKNFDWLRGYLLFLYKKEYTSEDFSDLISDLDTNIASHQRLHFEKEEVKLLLQQIKQAPKDLEMFIKILTYSGMRTSEILKCSFKRDDKENISYLDLTDSNIKLKTASSYRRIPLHNELLGLVNYSSLFEFQTKYNNSTLKNLSKKANKLINEQITKDSKKVLYSLRHSLATFLKHEIVNEISIAELMGHSTGKSMTMTRYAGLQDLKILHKAINKLQYE